MTEDVYRELQKHLDTMPVGFPPTKSGVELSLLKCIFSPDEAKIASKLSYKYESLDVIHQRVPKMSIEELGQVLDIIVKKGGIHYKKVGDEKHYANAFLVIGMYEYQIHKLTKEFLDDMFNYTRESFGLELFGTGIPPLRVIPVEESMTPENHIATYYDLKQIIQNVKGSLAVAECVCRQATKLQGDPCKITSEFEMCLMFDHLADMYIDQGWARSITKEEALEIARKAEEIGLILEPTNDQSPYAICCCCSCCCGMLKLAKELPRPADLFATNYYAEVDPELCTGCETCVDRCQLDALTIVEDKSTVNRGRCIGCGNCVATCPAEAISLRVKDKVVTPANDYDAMVEEIKQRKDRKVRAEKRREERKKKRSEKKKQTKN